MRQTFYAAWMPIRRTGIGWDRTGAGGPRRRKAAVLITTLCLMSMLTLLVGCGSSKHTTDPGTTKGTFTVTVTGTSGNVSHSGNFSLTVQ